MAKMKSPKLASSGSIIEVNPVKFSQKGGFVDFGMQALKLIASKFPVTVLPLTIKPKTGLLRNT